MSRNLSVAGAVIALGSILPCCGAAGQDGSRPGDAPLAHRLFDANRCLERIERSPQTGTVVFHWGCGAARMIAMSCVHDRAGYPGLGPHFARPGWHCNHPLPVLDEVGRASDVAVGDVAGRAVWAACFVAGYGDFESRKKPYHGTPCWRALRGIGRAVNRTRRSPGEVAPDILPGTP